MDFKPVLLTSLLSSLIVPGFARATAYLGENMDEIVITATRYARPLSDIGSSISVITAKDMAKSQTVFVQDILQDVPGLSLNQNGAYGGVSSVRIRGASTAQTMVLLDGVEINDASAPGGGFNFANLDPNGIKRIEVLRGPQSILYGSDAIGGVINIITPTGEKGLEGSLFAEGGSYNSFRAGGNIAGGNDRINFSLSGSGITTDGISKADEDNGNTEADGYRNISLHGKVTGVINDHARLQLISRYVNNRTEVDGFGFSGGLFLPVDGNAVDYDKEVLIAGRGFFNFLDDRFKNTLSVEYSTTKRHNDTNGVESFRAKGERLNLDYFGHFQVNKVIGLSFGLQHEQTKSVTDSPEKFNIDSVFSEVSWQGIPGLTLTAGLRYDDHNQFGSTTTPRLTAAYYINNTKIFANWGKGFKAPSVFQLTYICGFCGLTAPNSALRPEQSTGWEVGINQAFIDDSIHLGVTYFYQNITDLIDFDFAVGFGNINNVHTKGVELFADARITKTLSLSGNYTFTNATDRATGLDLIRVPRHAAFGEIQWQAIPKLNLAFFWRECMPWGKPVLPSLRQLGIIPRECYAVLVIPLRRKKTALLFKVEAHCRQRLLIFPAIFPQPPFLLLGPPLRQRRL